MRPQAPTKWPHATDPSLTMSANESTRAYGPGHVRSTAFDYEFAGPKRTRFSPIDAGDIERVFGAVADEIDIPGYVSSKKLDIEGLRMEDVGSALAELANDDGCPLDLEQWSSGTPTVYYVKVAPPEISVCPDCDSSHIISCSNKHGTALSDWVCRACGNRFAQPDERDGRQAPRSPTRGVAKRLDRAPPGTVIGNGGDE